MAATPWKRSPRVPLSALKRANIPGQPLPDNIDYDEVLAEAVEKMSNGPQPNDFHAESSYWRDLLAMTGDLRTTSGGQGISKTWRELFTRNHVSGLTYIRGSSHVSQIGPGGFVAGAFSFRVRCPLPGIGSGSIAVVPTPSGAWKIWFLVTALDGINGFGDVDKLEKVVDSVTGDGPHGTNGINGTKGAHESMYDAVIVGAGQTGLMLLGRLKALGLKAVVLERNDTIGGNWLGRYESVKLHTSKYYSTMPFGHDTFHGDDYPYFLEAKDLARGFQRYVQDYGLEVRLSAPVSSANFSPSSQTWTVQGGSDKIKARHLVFAIGGIGQFPKPIQIPNRENYRGVAMHSVDYKSPKPWKGKRVLIVGTANTAHDVAEDMVEAEAANITMVQRGVTQVMPFEHFKIMHTRGYHSDAHIAMSDKIEQTMPIPVIGAVSAMMFKQLAIKTPEFFEGLQRRGFKADTASLYEIHDRAGGHYLDVGCSQLIIDGKIDIKHGSIDSFTQTGLRFQDGSTLDADVIIFATGFEHNLRDQVTQICGSEVGDRLEDNMGFDSNFDIRGVWRPHDHPRIWYASGEFGNARYFSRLLALQIKADIEGSPISVARW